MRLIKKADIVGAKIVEIHESYELTDSGLDCRTIYFTVDRGFTFVTPVAGHPWETIQIPSNAERQQRYLLTQYFPPSSRWFGLKKFLTPRWKQRDLVKDIKRRNIAGVFCGPFDPVLGGHYPWDGTIVFEDGSQAANNIVAPHGTGAAGLYYFPAGSDRLIPAERLVDYFSIPLEKD